MNYRLFIKYIAVAVLEKICLSSVLLAHGHGHHHHDQNEQFIWTQEKSDLANISFAVAGPGEIQNYTKIAGKVVLHPDHLAFVIPKAVGTVVEIRKALGDTVYAGEILAVIESKQIAEAKASLVRAQKRYALQKALWQKEAGLRGISAAQDYLSAELAYEEAALDLEYAKQNLHTLGFSSQEIESIPTEDPLKTRFFCLKAPIGGKILHRDLSLGQLVNESTQAFKIGNLDKVWIEMQVSQNDARFLDEGLAVKIIGSGDKAADVTICQFDPLISEETRKATAIAVLKNQEGEWTPGEYVSVQMQTSRTPVSILVSQEAIQKMKGIDYVFIQESCGNLSPCQVKVGRRDHQCVEILSGLQEGDTYVSCNAFCLKADYQKEEVEHSH